MHLLPRSFSIQSLQDFAASLPEDLLLCPVLSLREYLRRTSGFVNRPSRLFVSPRLPSRAMSKNGTVPRSCFERLLLIQVPVQKMVLLPELIVSVALLPLPHFSRTGRFLVF